ncbi:MAG: hypothetical protein ABI776_10725 [Nocardioidaceae bacterium]
MAVVLAAAGILTAPSATAAPAETPSWSQSRLAFVRANQIYTSSLTGASVTKITSSAKSYRPHWSPDGLRIAFVHESSPGVRDIWVMDADGSHKQQVTRLGDATEPTWSPDGATLAFGANGTPPYATSGRQLRTVRSTAPFGESTPVPDSNDIGSAAVVGTLAWSPDGGKIAYYSDSFPSSPDHYLLVYTIATHQIDEVAAIGGACCGEGGFSDPTWTPDGTALAYTTTEVDGTGVVGPRLAVTDVASQAPKAFPTIVGDADPDYSPDGTRVTFTHWSSIYRANLDGSRRVLVTTGYQPDWRPFRS